MKLGLGTWLDPEEKCYPTGRWNRRGRAWCEDGQSHVVVRAGIPDTFFSIPAATRQHGRYVRGYLTVKAFLGLSVWTFIAYKGGAA